MFTRYYGWLWERDRQRWDHWPEKDQWYLEKKCWDRYSEFERSGGDPLANLNSQA